MGRKTTAKRGLDCVEMKHAIQKKLWAEYESQKDRYPDYFAFITDRAAHSKPIRDFWKKVENARRLSGNR